ncbi:phage terminase large subunit-like protein [Rhodobium orientis]|uniref:Uncharacterized protein n=1 Tax=Rhodobium orientis TaxID=34017 RepID=A0A327JQK7_9HYPH|nr:hypothetical protein [Rhodobium orientis]MBB4303514.1 phage terminase large subunit-like protein [Rhodobium orientis]MBK5950445.1 hypothetical protein [Rhodobium orientis]RAI28331.1 hypothetical protein CH339_06845 [Rhodobium orientis]
MTSFNFLDPAELYTTGKRRVGQNAMTYRRFDSLAEAVRYSIEELSAVRLNGAILEVNGERFRREEIRQIYDSSTYPLKRQPGKADDAT